MTTLDWVTSACGLCGASSKQTTLLSSSSFGAPDLDSRPREPARSALGFLVATCPECGFADDADLALPEGAEAAAVQGIVDGDAYRALSADRALPAPAREFLCRALLSAKFVDLAVAGWDALRAAWIADDAKDQESARRCRDQALEYWALATDAGEPLLEEDSQEFEPLLIAETLRRADRFAECVAMCEDADDDGRSELSRLIAFVRQRALSADAQTYTVADAPDSWKGLGSDRRPRQSAERRAPNVVQGANLLANSGVSAGRDLGPHRWGQPAFPMLCRPERRRPPRTGREITPSPHAPQAMPHPGEHGSALWDCRGSAPHAARLWAVARPLHKVPALSETAGTRASTDGRGPGPTTSSLSGPGRDPRNAPAHIGVDTPASALPDERSATTPFTPQSRRSLKAAAPERRGGAGLRHRRCGQGGADVRPIHRRCDSGKRRRT
jgi:hypothetical protein